MPSAWPSLSYDQWPECCDTLHALTQVLGKLALAVAPPQPQLQHAALRLTARGWETEPLPAPDGSGSFVAVLDLRDHQAVVEHSAGETAAIDVIARPVAEITSEILREVNRLAGPVVINATPQEVSWSTALDADEGHRHYEPASVDTYFAAATQAALVLADYCAPFRGRATPVNAWWGSFDLAVNLFSGRPVPPPSQDFIMRNAMDAEEVAVGWWPGDERYGRAAFYAYAYPAPEGFSEATLTPEAARWEPELGEFILDWEDIREQEDPHALAVGFGRSAFLHACSVCEWRPELAATIQSDPPPVS